MSGRFVLTVHPDDAAVWKAMTGRDETVAPPVGSRAGLEHMLASAERNGVRITSWRELGEGNDR